ncbi:MAG TPA: vitamin K epoxide reductase family protein [Longilinea sp.]|nr:vitamin K epoxide reductase family protein [Longilinea sp.]
MPRIIQVLAALGLADAIYLTIMKFANNPQLCIQGVGDCWSVNSSKFSEIYGIPVALIGALGYVMIFALATLAARGGKGRSLGIYGTFGLGLIGVLFSAYLTYLEVYVIHAICPFCIASAVIMATIFGLSLVWLNEEL